jgi:hypothetical protein
MRSRWQRWLRTIRVRNITNGGILWPIYSSRISEPIWVKRERECVGAGMGVEAFWN